MEPFSFIDVIRREISRVLALRAPARIGWVTAYDDEQHRVKCRIEPWVQDDPDSGPETGWIPVATVWAGPGWGLFAPPSIGARVELQFAEGDYSSAFVSGRFHDAINPPISGVKQGEFVAIHSSGSQLKFHENGEVTLQSNGNLKLIAGGTIESGGTSGDATWNHTGTINASTDVTASGKSLATHTHPHSDPAGTTGVPN